MNNLINKMLESNNQKKILDSLERNRKEYSKDWIKDAEHFYSNSYYYWMEERIAKCKNILEIGCGAGFSTLALLERGHKVISIEENKYCIEETEKLLVSNGFKVVKIDDRQVYKSQLNSRYELTYKPIIYEIKKDGIFDAILIQGDIINDPEFLRWVSERVSFPIDAIVCWLLGTHASRGYNTIFDLNKIKDSSTARIYTQNIIYEICSEILDENGLLHIVDRALDIEGIDAIKNAEINHQDQALVSSMEVLKVEKLIYEEIKGMEMKVRELTKDSEIIDREGDYGDCDRIFISILSQNKISS